MPRFNVTYETVTPESAEDGEAESRGFICKGVGLREAVDAIGKIALEDCGSWFTNQEYGHGTRDYYATGREESRSLHPPRDITASSYDRLARLLQVRR